MAEQRFPSFIQSIPRGLLSFLGITLGGDYPRQLITQLQPTLDLLDFYASSQAQHYTATGTAVGTTAQGTRLSFTGTTVENLGDGTNVTVPQTESWLLLDATVDMNNGVNAADIFDVVFAVNYNTLANRFVVPPQTLSGNPYAAVATNQAYRSLDKPVFLSPGNELVLRVIRATAAAGTPFVPLARLRLLRFRL